MSEETPTAGKPGEAGQPGTEGRGGTGGRGGAGGRGGQTGGLGGPGGPGGEYAESLGHAPLELTEEAKEEARQEIREVIDNGPASKRKSLLTLLAVSILTGVLVSSAFFLRARTTGERDEHLCTVIYDFIDDVNQANPQPRYTTFLNALDCETRP